MKAYSESKTPPNERDKRSTPAIIFSAIQRELNLKFDIDVCAEKKTTKVDRYWSEEDNALSFGWRDKLSHIALPVGWMNPPYSSPKPWCEKAYNESKNGMIVVGLLPDDRSTNWYQEYVEKATTILIPTTRISFNDARGIPQPGNPKGSAIVVWTPFHHGPPAIRYIKLPRQKKQ